MLFHLGAAGVSMKRTFLAASNTSRVSPAGPSPPAYSGSLAETPTRLKRLDDEQQERLINWGYAVCDAALRAHVDPSLPRADKFPYPAAKV
jgi:NTE family protein